VAMGNEPLVELLRLLNEHGVKYFVVGGMAANALCSLITTDDVDVCAPFDQENLRNILAALEGVNPRLRFRPDLMPVPKTLPEIPNLRNLNLVTDLGVIDFLDELEGVGNYQTLVDRTVMLDLGMGVRCRVIDLDTLIEVKKIVNRPKDRDHLYILEAARRERARQPGLFDPPTEHGPKSPD
jgi:hypothetical protein